MSGQKRPNIVFILSDDQDRRLGSTDFQSVLQREIVAKGVEFTNHYGTTAQCCPARTSILRGQFSHNTNITHVNGAGGNYDKWLASRQDEDYMPLWLKEAGYRTEYIGKFLNGYNTANWANTPKHWDWMDTLVRKNQTPVQVTVGPGSDYSIQLDPYTTFYNIPVLSQNGQQPIYYKGFHQTDVIRIKAESLDRLERLVAEDAPFYLTIAPYAPHVQNNANRPIPLKRHMDMFTNAKAPRNPNWNPADEFQLKKGSWLRNLPLMNKSAIDFADFTYQSRAQALQGVDEIIEDVVRMLEAKGVIDNTYIVYTSDNGYHIGQNRAPAGKALFYAEDTNLPFAVRGPGIPKGLKSSLPSTHVDLAPTFLDIAGLARENGREHGKGNARETLNIEFWGLCTIEAPSIKDLGGPFLNNTYKTVRILGDKDSWLFTKWCTGDVEMYHTSMDQWELRNIADSEDPHHKRALTRLNAILMVTKSCEKGSCRDPWAVLKLPSGEKLGSFEEAMSPSYDAFFDQFPRVSFQECLQVQSAKNEAPFYPPLRDNGMGGLGRASRAPTDHFVETKDTLTIRDTAFYGDNRQRNATLEDLYAEARELTDEELGTSAKNVSKRWAATESIDMRLHGYD
ncbi:alkaline-phosphatase-like protein [Phaeosphaeriaceae sp. PMI808]|nr:alkaline-phosphatase-like protein [Phaeosphaeriaceae sp. PMI808]